MGDTELSSVAFDAISWPEFTKDYMYASWYIFSFYLVMGTAIVQPDIGVQMALFVMKCSYPTLDDLAGASL